jgi:Arm DNA-binding domain
MIARYRPKRKRAPAKRKHFTKDNVRKLPRKGKQYLIWDAGTGAARGLAVLVSPSGTKSYRCVFYYPGSPKPHWMHLGRVGEMTLADARARSLEARGRARRGEDPTAHDATKSDAFETAVSNYIQHDQIGRRKNKSAEETKKVMLHNCEAWHRRPVATIRFSEIDALLEAMRDGDDDNKPRPYLANRLHAHLKDFFGWCVRKQMIPASPMVASQKPWSGAQRRTREWFKGDAGTEAVKALWRAADEIGGHEGKYLKVMLLTGKRRTALAKMLWQEIGADWFWDAPPGSRTKRLHGVPLPGLAQRILHPRRKTGTVFEAIDYRQLTAKVQKLAGIDDFFLHGTRHLVETQTAALRDANEKSLIPPHIRDLLFDHATSRGSGAGYDHHEYVPEMRSALEAWADHVERLVAPAEGVTRLR